MSRPGPAARRRLLLALGTVLVVTASTGGWAAASARGASSVAVSTSVRCTGAEVRQGSPAPTVRLPRRDDWGCVVEVSVHNGSWRAVRVTSLEGTILGPAGGAVVRGLSTGDARLRDARTIDAVWDVDLVVAAGGTGVVDLALGDRPDGRTARGLLRIHDFPTATVSVLGIERRASAATDLLVRTP